MRRLAASGFILLLAQLVPLLTTSCGSKSPEEVVVELACSGDCATLFNDADLADIYFVLSITTGDDTTNVFFPEGCAADPPPPECGFKKDVGEFRLDPDPLEPDDRATLTVFGRDVDGDTLFQGSATITNSPTSKVTITVVAITP